MIRRYCDCCKAEMPDGAPGAKEGQGSLGRLSATVLLKDVKVGVEVIRSVNGVTNGGDVCKYCILDALYELDDRPKAPEAYANEVCAEYYFAVKAALGFAPMDSHERVMDRAKAAIKAIEAKISADALLSDNRHSDTPMGCFRGPEFKDSRNVG